MGTRPIICWPRRSLIASPLGSSGIVFVGKGKLRYTDWASSASSSPRASVASVGDAVTLLVVAVAAGLGVSMSLSSLSKQSPRS